MYITAFPLKQLYTKCQSPGHHPFSQDYSLHQTSLLIRYSLRGSIQSEYLRGLPNLKESDSLLSKEKTRTKNAWVLLHTFCLQNITLSVNHWFFLTILSNFRFGLVLKKWCLIKVSTGWQNIQGEPFSIAVKKNEKKGKNTIYLHSKKNISFDPSTKTKYMIIKLLYSEFCILMSYKVTKALGGQTLTWLRRRPKPANAFIAYCSRFNLTVYNQYRENCIIQGLLF